MKSKNEYLDDDKNPDFLFDTTDTDLLLQIANGDLDPIALAKKTLANRGLGKEGRWVGFDKAEKIWSEDEELRSQKEINRLNKNFNKKLSASRK